MVLQSFSLFTYCSRCPTWVIYQGTQTLIHFDSCAIDHQFLYDVLLAKHHCHGFLNIDLQSWGLSCFLEPFQIFLQLNSVFLQQINNISKL